MYDDVNGVNHKSRQLPRATVQSVELLVHLKPVFPLEVLHDERDQLLARVTAECFVKAVTPRKGPFRHEMKQKGLAKLLLRKDGYGVRCGEPVHVVKEFGVLVKAFSILDDDYPRLGSDCRIHLWADEYDCTRVFTLLGSAEHIIMRFSYLRKSL